MIGLICWIMAGFSSYAAYSLHSMKGADIAKSTLHMYHAWYCVFVVAAVLLFIFGVVAFITRSGSSRGYGSSSSSSDDGWFGFMGFGSDSDSSCHSSSDWGGGGGDCGGSSD